MAHQDHKASDWWSTHCQEGTASDRMMPSNFKWTMVVLRMVMKYRLQLLGLSFVLLFLNLFTANPEVPCPNFMRRQEKFANCSGCFPSAHIPVLINQPQICATSTNQTIDIIIMVYTRVEDEETRNLIRQTWASVSKNNTSNFRHVFMLGTSPDTGHMLTVQKESDVHRDVVVTDFQDSYLNLTLKTVTSLHWITRHCGHARFFLKIDDDVWLNTKGLLQAFNKHAGALLKGLGGCLRVHGDIVRDTSSKWYASCESYPSQFYPTYVHGPAYGGTLQLAKQLSASCQDVPFFHMEDVFLGLCQELLGLTVVRIEEMQLWKRPRRLCKGKRDSTAVVCPVTSELMRKYWLTEPCRSDCGVACEIRSWFFFGVS